MATEDVITPDQNGFSIGEAAAIVGVSTHVIRSWERRLSIGLNHRTVSNQRRYWLQDVQRFAAIRKLHVSGGLPLAESAARALSAPTEATMDPPLPEPSRIKDFWGRLIDTLPLLLLVLDEAGKVVSANAIARSNLHVRIGASFTRFAPGGWKHTYQTLQRTAAGPGAATVIPMRSRSGIMFVDASVVPLGHTPKTPVVLIGSSVREQSPSFNRGSRARVIGA